MPTQCCVCGCPLPSGSKTCCDGTQLSRDSAHCNCPCAHSQFHHSTNADHTMAPNSRFHRTVQTHEVGSGKRLVGKMTQFSFLPNSTNSRSRQPQAPGGQNDPILVFTERCKLTSVVRQSGKSRMTILDFTEQNHVVLDFSGNVLENTERVIV
jgi:hypothetical protein